MTLATNLYNDPDGVLRRFIAALSDAQEEVWPTFSALLAGRLAHRNFAGEAQPPTFIDFAVLPGPSPGFPFSACSGPTRGWTRPSGRLKIGWSL